MLHLTTSSLRQFYRIVVSKHFLWGNFTELYSQNISFKTTLRSRIIQKSLWGNSAELYSQNINCKTTLRCIPTFCLKATVRSCIPTLSIWGNSREFYSQNISFKAILRNYILKIFPSRQLSGVVLYKSLFEAILRNCILTWHSFGVTFRSCIPTLSIWGNSREFYSQNISFEATLQSCILTLSF